MKVSLFETVSNILFHNYCSYTYTKILQTMLGKSFLCTTADNAKNCSLDPAINHSVSLSDLKLTYLYFLIIVSHTCNYYIFLLHYYITIYQSVRNLSNY